MGKGPRGPDEFGHQEPDTAPEHQPADATECERKACHRRQAQHPRVAKRIGRVVGHLPLRAACGRIGCPREQVGVEPLDWQVFAGDFDRRADLSQCGGKPAGGLCQRLTGAERGLLADGGLQSRKGIACCQKIGVVVARKELGRRIEQHRQPEPGGHVLVGVAFSFKGSRVQRGHDCWRATIVKQRFAQHMCFLKKLPRLPHDARRETTFYHHLAEGCHGTCGFEHPWQHVGCWEAGALSHPVEHREQSCVDSLAAGDR